MKRLNENSWISFSDLMTGLMVIFMFIAIAYMLEVEKKQNERDIIFEEFKATKDNLYAELQEEFKDDFEKWEVELDKDLSIKFTNPEVLFESGEATVKDTGKAILDGFLPRYFDVLLQEKYQNNIEEIRFEGHTDHDTIAGSNIPYIGNLELSQDRSRAVMEHYISSSFYKNKPEPKRWWILYKLTANGLSYGKTIDDNKEYTYLSGKPVNKLYSRRVEFRIVTTSKSLVEKVLNDMENE
jgi:outer membrane protein OmpA-like peptidoglycan-associated protein